MTTASRILWANVHLMPDPAIPTVETGTRHRTAERVARQAGVPVISVSHSMRTITLYVEDWRHVLEDVGSVLSRANQAVATLTTTGPASTRPAPSTPTSCTGRPPSGTS